MTQQIKPSVTNPTIARIYGDIREKKLEIAPDFQRRFVWTQEHQEKFIDTILHGFPFPEIYVCRGETNIKTLKTTEKVIDGQQRLTTIVNYIENNFAKDLTIIKPFNELDDDIRERFLEYELVVRDIGKVSDEIIREVFRRINLTKFKLEDIEIHNAVYDGKFISSAKNLSSQIDLMKYDVFYDSELTRMIDVHFFLLVLSTLENESYFTRDTEVEKCIIAYNEIYENEKLRKGQILKAFHSLDSLELPLDSIWFRKSNFFTLIIELAQENLSLDGLRDKLITIEEEILQNKNTKDNIYGEYYSYMYTGTNNRKSRIKRAEILKELINSKIK